MTTPMSVSYRFTLAFESYLRPCSAQRRLQFLFAQRGADEEFLPGAGAQGDGFPAVLRGDGDVHADFSAGIADGADDAGDDRADGGIGMQQVLEDFAHAIDDAVLHLEAVDRKSVGQGKS